MWGRWWGWGWGGWWGCEEGEEEGHMEKEKYGGRGVAWHGTLQRGTSSLS